MVSPVWRFEHALSIQRDFSMYDPWLLCLFSSCFPASHRLDFIDRHHHYLPRRQGCRSWLATTLVVPPSAFSGDGHHPSHRTCSPASRPPVTVHVHQPIPLHNHTYQSNQTKLTWIDWSSNKNPKTLGQRHEFYIWNMSLGFVNDGFRV